MNNPSWSIRQGDVLDRLAEMADASVHCVVTSPPYWGLRFYGAEPQMIGLEATPALYLERMVAVFREVRRVMRPDGTCWVNMGDGYNSIGGHTQIEQDGRANRAERSKMKGQNVDGLKPKDLIGMPWRLAFALQDDGWYLRSEIIWAKPNPMPESVTDRPTKSHEQIFLLTKNSRYFYDADAIREPQTGNAHSRGNGSSPKDDYAPTNVRANASFHDATNNLEVPGGRNARTVWTISTQPYPEAHFATFPEELPRRCILAGTSERGVCPQCGAPWTRVVELEYRSPIVLTGTEEGRYSAGRNRNVTRMGDGVDITTTGWQPSCAHGLDPIPATVLDPFAGSGTTIMVALQLGRSGIGIELSPTYAEQARRRVIDDAPLFNYMSEVMA